MSFTTIENLLCLEKKGNLVHFEEKGNKDVTIKIRAISIDWVIEVANMFKLRIDTIFHAVNLLDACLMNLPIAKDNLQLYAIACLVVAGKKYEIYSPEIADYVYVADGAFSNDTILDTEKIIMRLLKFDMELANISEFNDSIGQKYNASEYGQKKPFTALQKVVVDYTCVYWMHSPNALFAEVLPSVVATAVFHISRLFQAIISKGCVVIDVFNPFKIDESMVYIVCKSIIKGVLRFEKSTLKSTTTILSTKLKMQKIAYDQFTSTMATILSVCLLTKTIDTDATKKYLKTTYSSDSILPLVNIKEYERIKSIGSGTFGSVHVIRKKGEPEMISPKSSSFAPQGAELFALKKTGGDGCLDESNGLTATYLREVSILVNLRHPNIVKAIGATLDCGGIVMELMDGDLKSYYENNIATVLQHDFQNFVTSSLLSGLEYMHNMGVLNRDIKPQNILVRGTWKGEESKNSFEVKFCDFGLSRGLGIASTDTRNTSEVCTLWYRPIELLLGSDKNGSPSIDVWSLGCTLFETFTGAVLFKSAGPSEQIQKIFKTLGTPERGHYLRTLPDYDDNAPSWKSAFERVSSHDKNIAKNKGILEKIKSVKEHKILTIIKACLEYDPTTRASAAALLRMLKC